MSLQTRLEALVAAVGADIKDLRARVVPPVVTALPLAPTDGQEVYLEVDKASLYGGPFLWHCRYSSAYFKPAGVWHVLGDPARMRVEGVGGRDWNVHEETTSLNAQVLPTPGPAIIVPFAGTYDVTGRALSLQTGGGAPALFLWKTGDGGPSWVAGDSLTYAGPSAGTMDQANAEREFTLAAGVSIELRYATSNTSVPTQFYNRNIYLRPIRLNA